MNKIKKLAEERKQKRREKVLNSTPFVSHIDSVTQGSFIPDLTIKPNPKKYVVKKKGKQLKILLLSVWYPLTMSKYFLRAFQRRSDVEIRTIGPYTASTIPWQGGMQLLPKYAECPTYPTYPVKEMFSWTQAQNLIEDWVPDLVITIGDRIWFDKRPDVKCPVIHVATDPHVVNYDYARTVCDKFYSMQFFHKKADDIWLPYAFDPSVHFPTGVEKTSDCVLVGVDYNNRKELIGKLRQRGTSVIFKNGPVFDEYRELNNQAKIGLTYSCLNDIGARVFELMAMNLTPVIDRVSDLPLLFEENVHYLGFSSVQEGVEKVEWALANADKAKKIADNAYELVWKMNEFGYPQHSYDARVDRILREVRLVK